MFATLFHPLLLLRVLGMFLPWYTWEVPVGMVRTYRAYARALGEVFSLRFLLRTLFSLWKGIADEYPQKGIRIDQIFGTFCLNTISRVIGCLFRLCTIVLGIGVQLLCLIIFVIALALWLAYPVGVFFGVRFLLPVLVLP